MNSRISANFKRGKRSLQISMESFDWVERNVNNTSSCRQSPLGGEGRGWNVIAGYDTCSSNNKLNDMNIN